MNTAPVNLSRALARGAYSVLVRLPEGVTAVGSAAVVVTVDLRRTRAYHEPTPAPEPATAPASAPAAAPAPASAPPPAATDKPASPAGERPAAPGERPDAPPTDKPPTETAPEKTNPAPRGHGSGHPPPATDATRPGM